MNLRGLGTSLNDSYRSLGHLTSKSYSGDTGGPGLWRVDHRGQLLPLLAVRVLYRAGLVHNKVLSATVR